jgi:hypothetical protein
VAREKFESDQQAGVLKNERPSLILATYQRNLETTEQKLAASQRESIDLHIQIKQLIQNSSKLQHQIKDLSAAASANNLNISPETLLDKPPLAPVPTPPQTAVPTEILEQQQQYSAIFTALTEQIRELKDQMRSNANPAPARVPEVVSPLPILSSSPSSAATVAGASGSEKNAAVVGDPTRPASVEDSGEKALSKQNSKGALSRAPTPPDTPSRYNASTSLLGRGVRDATPETTPR